MKKIKIAIYNLKDKIMEICDNPNNNSYNNII